MSDLGVDTPWRVVVVSGVQLELPGVHPEVVLTECEVPWRSLRIPVGFAEGRAIAYAFRAIPTPRPLTHELFAELLERHGVDVGALRITARQGALFLAELETAGPRGSQVVPCRPSDGLALVLRGQMVTPILVAEGLFEPVPAAQAPEPEPEHEQAPAPTEHDDADTGDDPTGTAGPPVADAAVD